MNLSDAINGEPRTTREVRGVEVASVIPDVSVEEFNFAYDRCKGDPPSWVEIAGRIIGRRAGALTAEPRVRALKDQLEPIPMLLACPACHWRHIDIDEFATKPHHTHACQHCGFTWRPAVVDTVGVQFLPGFKNSNVPPEPERPSDPTFRDAALYGATRFWRKPSENAKDRWAAGGLPECCRKYGPPCRSSVTDAWVHTDTGDDRIVCQGNWPK